MKIKGNTILITGGGSGIGRGLAEALHGSGNQVIIAGRRQAVLDKIANANPGMRAFTLDITDAKAIREFGLLMAAECPQLNVLVNNAGIERPEKLLAQAEDLADVNETVATNLLGPIRLTAALLPHLQMQSRSAVVAVASALAFVPFAAVPTYCATKAAMHSYMQSLRYQLRKTTTQVIEVIPPYVQTELGPSHANDPRAMPVQDFVAEVMTILQNEPDAQEVVVERSKPLRFATEGGKFDQTFMALNSAMTPESL